MGTKHKGTIAEIRALNTWLKMVRAMNRIKPLIEGHLQHEGLTPAQFGVLEILYHLGPLCQKQISEKQLTSAGNITMVVNNLIKLDLVKKDRDPVDKRYYKVGLKDRGVRKIKTVFLKHAAIITDVFSVLNNAEHSQLSKLSKKIGMSKLNQVAL